MFSYTNNLSEDNVLAYKVFTPDFYSEWNDNIIDGNISMPVPISSRATPIDRCRRLANFAR